MRECIQIVGGVSSTGCPDRNRAGFQFLGRRVLKDALVCALIESSCPFGIGVGHGFTPTGEILHVKETAEDGRRIVAFHQPGEPARIVERLVGAGAGRNPSSEEKLILLEGTSPEGDPVLAYPHALPDGTLRLLRRFSDHATVRLLEPDTQNVVHTAKDLVRQSLERVHIDNPVAYIWFGCVSRQRRAPQIGLKFAAALSSVGEILRGAPCIGGLFDGEAGIDRSGHSLLMNWAVSGVVLGDEMRERCVIDLGFLATAKYGPMLLDDSRFDDVVDHALRMVYESGYPGAALYLVYRDQGRDRIISRDAVGSCLARLAGERHRPVEGTPVLYAAMTHEEPEFIPVTPQDAAGGGAASEIGPPVSQYVIPLRQADASVFAILQIDLGDCSYHTDRVHPFEEKLLRAQDGWLDPRWVNAARYRRMEGFTGTSALADEPRYIADMLAYRKETKSISVRKYSQQVFGQPLSEAFNMEAISLPLKIGQRRLGVLNFYRRIPPAGIVGKPGFTTVDHWDLKEAAKYMSGLVDAVFAQEKALWEREEQRRGERVVDALLHRRETDAVEPELCRVTVRHFRAARVDLFLAGRTSGPTGLDWASGARRIGAARSVKPDEIAWSAYATGEVKVQQRRAEREEQADPLTAATDGLVMRACVPLVLEEQTLGVLDVHWAVRRLSFDPSAARHDVAHLLHLGARAAAIIRRQQLRDERRRARVRAERQQMAMVSMGAMLTQSPHRLVRLLGNLKSIPDEMAHATDAEELHRWIEHLRHEIQLGAHFVGRTMALGGKVRQVEPVSVALRDLVCEAFQQTWQRFPERQGRIETEVIVSADVDVWVDTTLMIEALSNIIENAFRAVGPNGRVAAWIDGAADADGVTLVIEDNGRGMTSQQIEAAKSGWYHTNKGGMGVGVLIASLLTRANWGTFDIRSEPGRWTRVAVSLPRKRIEDDL